MVTRVDVANMALSYFDEAPIASLEDNDRAARMLNLHFETTREAELMKRAWKFATNTGSMTGIDLDTVDSAGLHYQYDVPLDALRILPMTYDNEGDGVPISWEIRDGKVYSDQESPRGLRYIANLTDPDDWNALFTEVMSAALAVKVAYPITHKTNMIQIAQNAYDRAVSEALRVNAADEGQYLYTASWAYQRGDTRHWRS